MSYRLFIVILVFSVTQKGFSQQNFFNVPSSDITPKKKLFIQEQLNFAKVNVQSGTTFSYGLGRNLEIGTNILGAGYDYNSGLYENNTIQPFTPFFTLNLQKKMELDSLFSLALGTQTGFTNKGKSGAYVYLNSIYYNKSIGIKLVGGMYYTSDSYFGPETRNFSQQPTLKKVGLQVGLEKNIWADRLFFQTDFISGKHSVGEVVIGGAYYINQNLVLSLGYQQPTFNSKSMKSTVFEITYVPKPMPANKNTFSKKTNPNKKRRKTMVIV